VWGNYVSDRVPRGSPKPPTAPEQYTRKQELDNFDAPNNGRLYLRGLLAWIPLAAGQILFCGLGSANFQTADIIVSGRDSTVFS
jgi:hypothetical protein